MAMTEAVQTTSGTMTAPEADRRPTLVARNVNVYYGYGSAHAIKDVSIDILANEVTAFIGPSGCGKSTFLRCINRMNDTIPGARVEGKIVIDGEDVNDCKVDPVLLRVFLGSGGRHGTTGVDLRHGRRRDQSG